MLRMMKMELAVLKKYLKQITFTMLIVIVCLVVGMGSAGGRIAWPCP